MNGEPRKQVLEQLDALKREIAEYHRWLAEFPDVCRVLENLMLRIERPLPGTEQARYRSIGGLREELRAMRAHGVMVLDEAQLRERVAALQAEAARAGFTLLASYAKPDGSIAGVLATGEGRHG
jgi:hypothetical protein